MIYTNTEIEDKIINEANSFLKEFNQVTLFDDRDDLYCHLQEIYELDEQEMKDYGLKQYCTDTDIEQLNIKLLAHAVNIIA